MDWLKQRMEKINKRQIIKNASFLKCKLCLWDVKKCSNPCLKLSFENQSRYQIWISSLQVFNWNLCLKEAIKLYKIAFTFVAAFIDRDKWTVQTLATSSVNKNFSEVVWNSMKDTSDEAKICEAVLNVPEDKERLKNDKKHYCRPL